MGGHAKTPSHLWGQHPVMRPRICTSGPSLQRLRVDAHVPDISLGLALCGGGAFCITYHEASRSAAQQSCPGTLRWRASVQCVSGRAEKGCLPPIRSWGVMRMSSNVSLGGGDVGGRGVLRGRPGRLLAGSSPGSPEDMALTHPLRVCTASAAAAQDTVSLSIGYAR